jgi:predicted DsbA family dithiol-disulfide isomerase
MKKLRIDIWSDIACPWCYVGKRRLEAALAQFPERASVQIVWRAFELDPSAPRVLSKTVNYAERLAKKYGTSTTQAQGMIDRMTDVARADGLDFHFERIQPGNTFDAHRVLHFAAEHGKQDALKERFLRGYLTDGEPIGDPETLVRLAAEVGLDEEQVRATLASDSHAREVRADENEARANNISGVPFFVFDGRFAVSGAQPADLFLQALGKAWSELQAKPVVFDEGATCGPDGCN